MVTTVLFRLRQVLLLTLLTVSLTATAFAHRMPSPDDGALAFALANGMTLADLCASDVDVDGDGQRDGHCPACQITAAPGLPATAPTLIDLELAFVLQVVAPRESRALARILDPARSPQGPPTA